MNTEAKTIQIHFLLSQINRSDTNFFWRFGRQRKQHITIFDHILLFFFVYTNILIVILIHNIV